MKRVYAFVISLALFALEGLWFYGIWYESPLVEEALNTVKILSFAMGTSAAFMMAALLIGALGALWYALRED